MSHQYAAIPIDDPTTTAADDCVLGSMRGSNVLLNSSTCKRATRKREPGDRAYAESIRNAGGMRGGQGLLMAVVTQLTAN